MRALTQYDLKWADGSLLLDVQLFLGLLPSGKQHLDEKRLHQDGTTDTYCHFQSCNILKLRNEAGISHARAMAVSCTGACILILIKENLVLKAQYNAFGFYM